jgi:type IV secretion system protein VirB10
MMDAHTPKPPEDRMDDPHGSKISPDDPRLRLPTMKSRSLKKAPVIVIGTALLTVLLVAMSLAMWPKAKKAAVKEEPDTVTQQFVIPDVVRHGPGNTDPVTAPSVPDDYPQLGEPLPGDLGHAMIQQDGSHAGGQYQAESPEEAERDAALKASPFFGGGNNTATGSSAAGAAYAAAGQTTLPPAPAASPYGRDQNMQDRKNDFYSAAGGDEKEYLSKSMHQPVSRYEVKAGSIIPILLVTGINSDLPGSVIGLVNQHVYDTRSGAHLLIPQGTRVVGKYDSMVSYGQKRVLVSWNRLIRPDGSSIVLENMPGADLSGNAGYQDKVDNHFDRLVGGVVLSSMLSVGATISQGTYSDSDDMSTQQRMAASLGQNVASAGGQITRKNLDIQPSLKILAGQAVNILVNKDMIIKPYNP